MGYFNPVPALRRPLDRGRPSNVAKGVRILTRDSKLQTFLTAVAEAMTTRDVGAGARALLNRVYRGLESHANVGPEEPCRLPACDHLGEALAVARGHSPPLARIADSLAALEPSLAWKRRTSGGAFASHTFAEGHANAMIVGPGGLEIRQDIHIGVSLLAPRVRYPDHSHPPEEVYLVLSRGRFKHGDSDWFEPGVGGTLHNSPNLVHAMASDTSPLLAVWLLWAGTEAMSRNSTTAPTGPLRR